jgi:hypothetical protein
MRFLTADEIEEAMDEDPQEALEEGEVAIEATIQELADLGVETFCGSHGNKAFKALADKGYGKRKCIGWFFENPRPIDGEVRAPYIFGMFHIKIQTDETAEKIQKIAGEAEGSLRYNGDSMWEGFKEFEIE